MTVRYPPAMRPIQQRPIVKREIERFRAEPASIRNAAWVLISVTIAAVIIGAVVLVVFSRDFEDFGTALWFTLQTVTTVGYGDVTPTTSFGRLIASIVMVVAIGFLTVVTALITSTFVSAAQRQMREADVDAEIEAAARTEARLDQLVERLEAIEASLERIETGQPRPQASPASVPTTGTPPSTTPDAER
jgi:voltage-gated potassium channel